ncbi:AAA family ATPase [Amnibacterium setariae]|uniref:ATP-binding protein n=1 Tax=Amnibacterium setariae TaxID=2306585 RepID=A0A3A1U9G1_9MICO|nr:ATP-binding protein [Amnibacterium setariae]RIX29996.1 ATP-binding protein [Amnibacterium setariae]
MTDGEEHGGSWLVLVVGRPASGKTTVSRLLADRLGIPRIAKDDLKEILFDELGGGDRDWSVRLGRASFALLGYALERQLTAGGAVVVDANYDPRVEDAVLRSWQRRYGFRALQLHCRAGDDELVRRFAARAGDGSRHAGHGDAAQVDAFRAVLGDGRPEVLDLDGVVLEVDTERPGAVDAALAEADALLTARSAGR